jgi:hypothetical protein
VGLFRQVPRDESADRLAGSPRFADLLLADGDPLANIKLTGDRRKTLSSS